MTETERVYWALQQFMFAAKFAACCDNQSIYYNVFKPVSTVRIPNDVTFDIPEWDIFNQEGLMTAALNQMMTSLGACSIAVDEALSSRDGNSSFRNWQNNQNDLNSLR
ncbi:hypothetical protein [uncultured Shewanella sp.]|uniref:hypothetical protein n=1 Tax=uncultured Shewanella sp. TaxID=173975 RepID=UPI00260DFC3B|nr:hypothetical protein [uncultured Shewanella sp.]